MKSLKQILVSLLNEKQGYNMVKNPDSIYNRSSAARKVHKGDGSVNPLTGEDDPNADNDQQASGGDIAKKMDFDIEPAKSIHNSEPLSFMDVVYDMWGVFDDEEEEDNDNTK